MAQKPRPTENIVPLFGDDDIGDDITWGRQIIPPAPAPLPAGAALDLTGKPKVMMAIGAALDRGAIELRMPRLAVAKKIEDRRLQFRHARDGIVPEDRKVSPLGWSDRISLRSWLTRMDAAMAPISSWIP